MNVKGTLDYTRRPYSWESLSSKTADTEAEIHSENRRSDNEHDRRLVAIYLKRLSEIQSEIAKLSAPRFDELLKDEPKREMSLRDLYRECGALEIERATLLAAISAVTRRSLLEKVSLRGSTDVALRSAKNTQRQI